MSLYMLVQITNGNKDNIGLFDSRVKAMAVQTSLELESFDHGRLLGLSFIIEEHFVK